MKIKKGKIDPELHADDSWFIRQNGNAIRQLRPTDQPTIKEMWAGSVNGMTKVGTFEIAHGGLWNHYSTAYYAKGVGLYPLSLQEWGTFLAEYVNSITDPETIEANDAE